MEHLTQKQFEDYSRQQLPVAELLTVSDHLGECEACRRRTEGALNADAAFLAIRSEVFADADEPPAHLTTEQIADYVDKDLSGDALQLVADHLASCAHCALAVDDVREFRNEIAPSLDREYRPATVPAATKSGWFASFRRFFQVAPVPAFGGAALAVLLLAVVGWFAWRRQSEQRPNEEIAVAPSPSLQPAPTPSPISAPTEPAAAVAQLNDGEGVLTLDQEGKLSGADKLPADYQNLVKKALATRRIERSVQLKGLTRASSSLMSADNSKGAFSVIDPIGSVVLASRPTFRWSRMEGASAYVVEVYDSKFTLVATSPQLTNNSWTAPQSLARGEIYTWQVKATKDGQEVTSPRPPAPQAKFRILDQGKANELAKAKRAYASSHLTLALLYADAGLLKESEQELRILLRANPNSDIVRSLLRQIQAQR